jgi:3-hydroxyisobutyrate dehydrogenase
VANAYVLSIVEGLAETIALAEGMGVDPERFLEAIAGGLMDSGYAQLKGKAMIGRDFEPSFALAGAAKDAGLIGAAAARHGLDLPMLAAIAERLADGVERGHGNLDMAATFLTSAR